MQRKNSSALAERVTQAAEAALAAQGHVSAIDVLVGLRWLDPALDRCLAVATETQRLTLRRAGKIVRQVRGQALGVPDTLGIAGVVRTEARTPG